MQRKVLQRVQRRTERSQDMKERTTKCECPCCGKNHKLRLNWIGSLPAKKLCPSCKDVSYQLNNSYYRDAGRCTRVYAKGGAE
jgi:ssDNA-binding Zn-finger/Zn-ribbon topoisomerase 1